MLRALLGPMVLALVFALPPAPADAQVTKDEILRSLTPKTGLTRSLKTRQIVIVPGKEAEVLDQNKELPKINLTIEFEYNSDQLTTDGMRQLAVLGDALKDPQLKAFQFLVAGHTDARGTPEYNQKLSERRAISVLRHLVGVYQIEDTRLKVVGFGKTRLLDPAQPDSPKNRRVEIVNIGN